MPCNTIQTNTVDLEKVPNLDLLHAALASEFGSNFSRVGPRFILMDAGRRVIIENGRATSSMGTADLGAVVGRVKQALTREAIKTAAKRFGWTVTKGADANHFAIQKG
jgi:hypothetical protein